MNRPASSSEVDVDTSFMSLPSAQKYHIGIHNSATVSDYAFASPLSTIQRQRPQQTQLNMLNDTTFSRPNQSMFSTSLLLATPGSSSRHFSRLEETVDDATLTKIGDVDDTETEHVDPNVSVCHAVLCGFAKSFQSTKNQCELFECVSTYEQLCLENVAQLKKRMLRRLHSDPSYLRGLSTYGWLKLEQQTWRLVASLYTDRLDTEAHDEDNEQDAVHVKHTSEKRLIDTLYEDDPVLRQSQLVVDWLEYCAADIVDNFYQKFGFQADKLSCCENTVALLQQHQLSGSSRQSAVYNNLVTQLDPDSVLRQGKCLDPVDTKDHRLLVQYLFSCVRSGQLAEAQRACSSYGELWRAATLNGWQLYDDANLCGPGVAGLLQKVEGNAYRDVWKKTCWQASNNSSLCSEERAMYASLCGNLDQLLPMMTNWQDYLWAYLKVLVDQRVETHIRTMFSGRRQLIPLPADYNNHILTVDKIFHEMESCSNERVRQDCNDRMCLIHKHIITDDIHSLMQLVSEWCCTESGAVDCHLLRFLAHLTLFLRAVRPNINENDCQMVLESYVKWLISEHHVELVATYVATLSVCKQVQWYASFLQGVVEPSERHRCLELAAEAGLDVLASTRLVVDNVRCSMPQDFNTDTDFTSQAATTPDDLVKVETLEWLLFNPIQRNVLLRQANAMMRIFLGCHKFEACRLTARKLPADWYEVIQCNWRSQCNDDLMLPAEDANAVREFLCIQAFLDAHESFSDWFNHYHAKPAAPQLKFGADFNERVTFEHKQRQFEAELDRWNNCLQLQTKTTVDKLYNVLLFVDGGWLVDSRTDGPVDELRARQLVLLRQLCLPACAMLLYQVLHTTNNHKACLQIADCIASEQYQLYKVFSQDELRIFLEKVRESSVDVPDSGLDPLGGYPLA